MSQKTFEQKAADLEVELAAVELELARTPEHLRQPLIARRASFLRSLDWYRRRIPRARPIESVGVSVGDEVETGEAAG